MENVKNITTDTTEPTASKQSFEKTKAYQDFINILSQIIEKHGVEVLREINHGE